MLDSIVNFEELMDATPDSIFVSEVTFIRDFGPFKKGEKVDSLVLEYIDQLLVTYSKDGEVIKQVEVTLTPKETSDE